MDDSLNEKARHAVIQELKLGPFFADEKDRIYQRLEECDRLAMLAPAGQQDVIFFAASFPVISGIIYKGGYMADFQSAAQWAAKEFPQSDPASTLSALTFVYVIECGKEERGNGKAEIWNRIDERLERLLAEG